MVRVIFEWGGGGVGDGQSAIACPTDVRLYNARNLSQIMSSIYRALVSQALHKVSNRCITVQKLSEVLFRT